jgi:large subunit ribosomal protein L23
MAILNKKKKTTEKPAPKAKKEKHIGKPKGFEYAMLKHGHITEKSAILAEGSVFVFRVASTATKLQIKAAIENLYGVNVEGIRTIPIRSKKRRRGRVIGATASSKKAYVKLKKGQTIDIFA